MLLLACLVTLCLDPINRGSTRVAIIAMVMLTWVFTLYLVWRKLPLRTIIIVISIIFLIVISIDGIDISHEKLRAEYVKALVSYEGTPYLWGGENFLGIDCSGLVRRGLIDADIKLGVIGFRPALIRQGIYLWYHDIAADAMRDEYRGLMRCVLATPSLNELDHSRIREGDVMVSLNGVHAMAYIGNRTWIEADPVDKKVVKAQVPESRIVWFKVPAKIMRWSQLN